MLDFNSKSMLSDRINFLIDDALPREEKTRDYLGASGIGHQCERHVQLYMMSLQGDISREPAEPRILRIWDRGNLYEERCRQWLKDAGFLSGFGLKGKAFSDFNGMFQGHVDDILTGWKRRDVQCPIPLPALWECKCLGSKWWKKLKENRLREYSSTYFAQVQVYMHYLGLKWCLFTAINADTMEIYHELIPYDDVEAMLCRGRVQAVFSAIAEGYNLNRISKDKSFYLCKMCDFSKDCWSVA